MKKEELKKIYDTPSEGFHRCVADTLDSLDAAPVIRLHRISRKKIVTLCAAAAVLAAFTVTAAATDMFGLMVSRRGEYGLNVKVENSDAGESGHQPLKMKMGYLPDAYADGVFDRVYFNYEDNSGDAYFNAQICYINEYDYDFTNVVKTEETETDGHKTVIITFKEAENSDKMYYSTLKYFEEYNCLVRCSGSDYDELVKITGKLEVEPDTEPAVPADLKDVKEYLPWGALSDYARSDDGFRDEYFAGNVQKAKVGESMELSVADYGQEAVQLTAKVTSVKEQDNVDGLDTKDFIETGYSNYFDGYGNLVKQEEFTVNEDADENNLGTLRTVTLTRHFYVADIELTAQEDIDDLHKAFGTNALCIDDENKFFYGFETLDYEFVIKVCETSANEKFSLKKGETTNIKLGFITENDTANISYITISAVDAPNNLYQNYMIRVKE